MRIWNLAIAFGLLLTALPPTGPSVQADEDPNLWEMPYVVQQVSTDIFVGDVVSIDEVIDVEDSRYFPGLDTIYSVRVMELVKGDADVDSIVQVRNQGGELNGVVDYAKGDGPILPGERYLFITRLRDGEEIYETPGYLDCTILLANEADRTEWVGRWTTAVNAGSCAGYLDVIRLNGTVYARRPWNSDKRFLEPEWVGDPIATVQRQDYAFYGYSPDLADGDASQLAVGTEILEMVDYSPSFRVVVRLPDKHRWLYEAVWSYSATVAEELLDVRDRVVRIDYGRSSFCNEKGCVDYASAGATDAIKIEMIAEKILAAPVEFLDLAPKFLEEDERGYVVFNLEDKSSAGFIFDINTGISTNGIQLDPELVKLILRSFDTPDGF